MCRDTRRARGKRGRGARVARGRSHTRSIHRCRRKREDSSLSLSRSSVWIASKNTSSSSSSSFSSCASTKISSFGSCDLLTFQVASRPSASEEARDDWRFVERDEENEVATADRPVLAISIPTRRAVGRMSLVWQWPWRYVDMWCDNIIRIRSYRSGPKSSRRNYNRGMSERANERDAMLWSTKRRDEIPWP